MQRKTTQRLSHLIQILQIVVPNLPIKFQSKPLSEDLPYLHREVFGNVVELFNIAYTQSHFDTAQMRSHLHCFCKTGRDFVQCRTFSVRRNGILAASVLRCGFSIRFNLYGLPTFHSSLRLVFRLKFLVIAM